MVNTIFILLCVVLLILIIYTFIYACYALKHKDWEFAAVFIVILLLEISFTIDFICRCLPIS